MMTSSSRARRNVPPPASSATGKGSVYSRFIPREELSSFAAWEPGDITDTTGEPPAAAAARAQSPEAMRAEAAQHLAEQVRLARQSGYQDGYRDGLVALEGFKQSFAHQATLQIGALLGSTTSQLDALQQQMAEALAATAVNLARQVVRGELATHPQIVVAVAREALDTLLLSARHITLRVHPDDHPLVADGAGDVLAARGARLVADPSITRGGCLVESSVGHIDASVETRWSRATATLGRDDAWDAGDASDGASDPAR
jgi:flagellar assembly protein FliH